MIQDIDTVSLVPRYPLGFRYALDDRVFRYALAGGALHTRFGAKNALFQIVGTSEVSNTLHTTAPIGAKTVVIDITVNDGIAANGAFAANVLAGGSVVFITAPAWDRYVNRRIVANTAKGAGVGTITLTLDKPLPYALTAVVTCVCAMASPYLNVQTTPPDSSYASVVGVPTYPAVLGEYVWLQTWGPLAANCDLVVGVNPNNRRVVFGPDGNMHPEVAGDAFNTTQGQIAGFVMVNSNLPPRGRGIPFIFLQITP